jgi:hypothetical protein
MKLRVEKEFVISDPDRESIFYFFCTALDSRSKDCGNDKLKQYSATLH